MYWGLWLAETKFSPVTHCAWWRHQMETFSAFLALYGGIHRSPVNSPHRGQWRGALKFSLIYARTNCWANHRDADDLRSHRAHYDVTVLETRISVTFGSMLSVAQVLSACSHGPLTRYVILRVAHTPRMPGTSPLSPPPPPPPQVSDPDMHHGTCRDACRDRLQRFPLNSVAGKTFPTFPAHAQPAVLHIW